MIKTDSSDHSRAFGTFGEFLRNAVQFLETSELLLGNYSGQAFNNAASMSGRYNAARGLLVTDHVILNHCQVRWTTPELAPPVQTTTPHHGRTLNGYVNKQNCRIWSEANPQVYGETPLHPEKLTVWFALWAGGILLQKRRRPQRYSQW
ncbi:hypothetical protein TNCV_3814061 [Trichonephila clavipes]|nr:hypothetical protein TNCV_3814061 [Trichonephila clavipes]